MQIYICHGALNGHWSQKYECIDYRKSQFWSIIKAGPCRTNYMFQGVTDSESALGEKTDDG